MLLLWQSRFYDSFNQYVYLFTTLCIYRKTKGKYTWQEFHHIFEGRFLHLFNDNENVLETLLWVKSFSSNFSCHMHGYDMVDR